MEGAWKLVLVSIEKKMLVKKRSETLLKVMLYVEISQKFSPNSYVQNAHSDELCLKEQIWLYWQEDNI